MPQGGAALLLYLLKKIMPSCAARGETILISTVWDNLKKLRSLNLHSLLAVAFPDTELTKLGCHLYLTRNNLGPRGIDLQDLTGGC